MTVGGMGFIPERLLMMMMISAALWMGVSDNQTVCPPPPLPRTPRTSSRVALTSTRHLSSVTLSMWAEPFTATSSASKGGVGCTGACVYYFCITHETRGLCMRLSFLCCTRRGSELCQATKQRNSYRMNY